MVSAAITSNLPVNASSASTSNVKKESSVDFGSIMKRSIGNNAQSNTDKTGDNVKKSDSKPVSKNNDVNSDENAVKSSDISKADKTENSKNVKDEISVDETKIKEAAKEVADKIKEELGLSDEELETLMAELGLNVFDLLNPAKLTEIFMKVAGADNAMMLVTDSELSTGFKQIMEFLNGLNGELAKELEISPQQLTQFVEEFSSKENLLNGDINDEVATVVQSDEESIIIAEDKSVNTDEAVNKDSELSEEIDKKLTISNENNSDENDVNSGDNKESFMEKTFGEQNAFVSDDSVKGDVLSNITETFKTAFTDMTTDVQPLDVVRQVVQSIKLNSANLVKSIEVQLNPESLGTVNVVVSVKEGIVSAQITTENEQVKKALESQMITLKETFENQGIKVDAVEVTVKSNAFESNHSFAQNKEQEQTSKSRKKINLDDLLLDDEAEEEQVNIHLNENSSVEYMA